MNPFAGRKGVNPAEVDDRGFLRRALTAMKIKINNVSQNPDISGYVNIPRATSSNLGVVQLNATLGFTAENGIVQGISFDRSTYDNLSTLAFISKGTLRQVFPVITTNFLAQNTTDVWTDAERLAVLSRLGVTVDQTTGTMTWSAQS